MRVELSQEEKMEAMRTKKFSDRKVIMMLLDKLRGYNVISPHDVTDCINAGIATTYHQRRKGRKVN